MTSAAAAHTAGLLWAFHAGFADYISRLEDGRITVSDGASLQSDGRALFPTAPAPTTAPTPSVAPAELWRGTGTLQFTGHHGLLAVTLAGPSLIHAEGRCLLTVDDPFELGQRMPLADLGPADRDPADRDPADSPAATAVDSTSDTLHIAEPLLTEQGADLFFGHYHRGTPLAPLDLLASLPTRPRTGSLT